MPEPVEPYVGPEQTSIEQTSIGGSKRRKRGKRNSKKNSRRRSKKYMKKMYRGGINTSESDSVLKSTELESTKSGSELELESESQSQPRSDGQGGGKRRRKGKMQKGKTRKGKVSKWITHVKNFSKTNKMDFRDALKDPKCKASYHKMK